MLTTTEVQQGMQAAMDRLAGSSDAKMADTHTRHLLPTCWDHRRLAAEAQAPEARAAATEVEREVPALARRAAAQLGTEQTATIAGAAVAMQIEHDRLTAPGPRACRTPRVSVDMVEASSYN